MLLTILHILFAALTFGFAVYGLLTKNFEYQHFMILSMGMMILVMGLKEFRGKRKWVAYLMFLAAAFILFVTASIFLTPS